MERSLRSVSVDDLRRLREAWEIAPISARKRIELLRGFFSFCLGSGWIQVNPAKMVKVPLGHQTVTMPHTDKEWERILWALDTYKEIHRQVPIKTCQKLRALVYLMRYSGNSHLGCGIAQAGKN
jgi:site-specific recombinase XerD